MNNSSLASLVFRVAGGLILFETAAWYPSNVSYYLSLSERSVELLLWYAVVPFVIPLVVGVALVTFPSTLSSAFLGERAKDEKWDEPRVLGLGIVGLGVYFLFRSLSDLVFNATHLFLWRLQLEEDYVVPPAEVISRTVATVAEILFAFYCLFGGQSFARWLLTIRGRA